MTPRSEIEGTPGPVRPRWVWTGLVIVLLGLLVVSAGMMDRSVAWIVCGLGLVAVGAPVSLHGGILRDTQRDFRPRQEVRDVLEGRAHRAPRSGGPLRSPRAQRNSLAVDAQRRALLGAATRTARPNLARPAATVALVVCTWLLIAQWSIYPMSRMGQNNALRDLGVGIAVALAALRVVLAGRRFRASVLMIVGGAALVLFAVLMRHDSHGVAVSELASGILILLSACGSLDRTGLPHSVKTN